MSGSRLDDASGRTASTTAIGVDVGGTKVACGLVDLKGRVLARNRKAIDISDGDGRCPAEQIAGMIRELADIARVTGNPVVACGIAVPAVVDREAGKVVWAPNIPGWRDFPLGEFLRSKTEIPVCLDHDGPAAVAGEQWVGAARGLSHVVLIIIGTGIGAGLILGGRVYRGSQGIAGGIGWSCLESDAIEAPLYRGKGFLETVAAGPGIAREVRDEILRGRTSLALEISGGDPGAITTEAVLAAAARGDEVAREVLARAVRYIGMATANLVSTFNPEIVVLGGGVGGHLGPYIDDIKHVVEVTAQPQAGAVVRVVTAELGDDAGVIGAAKIAFEESGVLS